MHLNIPTLQVGLLGVPPRRSGPSATETAEAKAEVDTVITHPDGSIVRGIFEYGIREFETQVPSGTDLLNLVDKEILEHPNPLVFTLPSGSTAMTSIRVIPFDPVALDLDLGVIQAGDIMSWVYTLTAQGTTHGFERGYYAFLGDPFGGEVVTDNLRETIGAAFTGAPEMNTSALLLLGFAGLLMRHWFTSARQADTPRRSRIEGYRGAPGRRPAHRDGGLDTP